MNKFGGGLIFLSFPIGAFGLGSWQVHRRQWKLGLIAELEEKLNYDPIQLIENLDSVNDMEYRKVAVSGKFDHTKEMYIGPRSPVTKGNNPSSSGGLISTRIKSGFNVVTPFILNKNISILVNRGWVPRKLKDPSMRQEGQIEGPVNLTGIIRLHENRPTFMIENTSDELYLYRDLHKMSEKAQTDDIFIDAVESVKGGPVGSQTTVTLRNEHLSYIFTWYSLSAITSYLWLQKYMKGKGKRFI